MKNTITVMLVSTLSAVVLSACFFVGKAVTSSEPAPTEPVPSSVTASMAKPSDTEIHVPSETTEPTAPAVPAKLTQEEQLGKLRGGRDPGGLRFCSGNAVLLCLSRRPGL